MLANPLNVNQQFPIPELRDATSYKGIAYLGFGGFGPVIWNNFYASFEKAHPSGSTTENYQGKNYTIYLTDLTDERTALFIGNELQLRIIPNRWDMAWGMVYGDQRDGDNNIAPSDWDRTYASTVLRSQFYLTDIFHVSRILSCPRIFQKWKYIPRAFRLSL